LAVHRRICRQLILQELVVLHPPVREGEASQVRQISTQLQELAEQVGVGADAKGQMPQVLCVEGQSNGCA